ncbi:MAG TPA: class I SAM-dependent methyltransferase, partial [Elusimicrobiales bacterium]|nr:class I SAM-dependent methyltransferase [Elusimicrobiales bacterium]
MSFSKLSWFMRGAACKILSRLPLTPARREELLRLYKQVHDLEDSTGAYAAQTQDSFAKQWRDLRSGKFLLSDPWFKDNVSRILAEEEILLPQAWFKGKTVLDAGCGNGRWAYGFAKLGADVTCVDVSEDALRETESALLEFSSPKEFVRSPLEDLDDKMPPERLFDLVFSWGVLHHCRSFNKALKAVASHVKTGGILYLYLYGRESKSLEQDLRLFGERLRYNSLKTEKERYCFLMEKAMGDETQLHNYHDIYAPLINRRFEFV